MDLKLVILGPSYVGKTSIINRYCNGSFIEDTLSTIGAGFFTHSLQIDGTEITLMLWDTAGEERFRSVAPSLLRGANGMILVFDITKLASFEEIDIYMDMFLDTCSFDPNSFIPVLLLGNKCDLGKCDVPNEAIEKWMKKNNVGIHYLVSAKTGENIQQAIEEFIKQIVMPHHIEQPINIVINDNNNNKSCC